MNKPWLKYYNNVPESIDYKNETIYEAVASSAFNFPQVIAYDFLGLKSTYENLLIDIDCCADSLEALGIRKGDKVTICLPNCPQVVIVFYALNKIGAIASLIHPLSATQEIEQFLKISDSRWAFTLDAFYGRFKGALSSSNVKKLIVTRLGDYMGNITHSLFYLTKGRKIPAIPKSKKILWWKDLMRMKVENPKNESMKPEETAVILYSGGTTGRPKGIELSSMNFNALGRQVGVQLAATDPFKPGDSILAILPVFHGFGLGVCVHGFLIGAGTLILVPQFNAEITAKLIKKKQPSVIAGVPTLFEALLKNKNLAKADLSNLKGVFGGGDKVPRSIKERFDKILKDGGSKTVLREGYGLTESVTVALLMPETEYREGSVGIPISDMAAKIVKPNTIDAQPSGIEGEICLSGPTIMNGYLNEPEETSAALKVHDDGLRWLHTGDLGTMDADGFVFFKLRMKRMIKVSGVSVYPTEIEKILDSHESVNMACAIGVPDTYQLQKVKAFVVLHNEEDAGPELEKQLMDYCRSRINKWSCPKEIEFRESLPVTKVGKIAFTELEKEELERVSSNSILESDINTEIIQNKDQMIKSRERLDLQDVST